MVRHRRLREADGLGQIAHAGLAVGLGCDEIQDAEPNGVRQGLESHGELLGIFLLQGALEKRRATGAYFCHAGILTYVDVLHNIDARRYPAR